jgi:hypothetical protein
MHITGSSYPLRKRTIKKALLVFCVLVLVGCQTQNPISLIKPTSTRKPSYVTQTPTLTLEQSPVYQAFQKLKQLDTYRMTVTIMDGERLQQIYLLEKNGQGKLRINYIPVSGVEYRYMVVDGVVYENVPNYVTMGPFTETGPSNGWGINIQTPTPRIPEMTEERYWWMFPTIDNGCWFDETDLTAISQVYPNAGLFRETIVVMDDAGYVMSNPPHQCELTIRDGYPFRIIGEAALEDRLVVTLFTNFDGEGIEPITAPDIP